MELSPGLGAPSPTAALRAFRASMRLGWEVSSNWTQPLLFIVYSVLRPISAALILVVMYTAIRGRSGGGASYLPFLVTGVAFWSFVQSGLADLASGVAEDRGRYRTLKYVYMSPQRFYLFLVGRGSAQLASAAASVAIVLLVATPILKLPIDPTRIDYPILAASCLLAFVAVVAVAVGYSVALLAARDGYGYGEAAAQMLYLISGAIFPLRVLPGWIAFLASGSPLVYWMELVRRSLLRANGYDQRKAQILMFPGLSDGEVLLRLLAGTAVAVIFAALLYRWADHRARHQGLIDQESNW